MKCLYEQDYYGWLNQQVKFLSNAEFDEIDTKNLIEELMDMSRKERRELINRLTVLFLSLLKWNFQPAKQSKSWQDVIKEQKNQVKALIEESPSLKPF